MLTLVELQHRCLQRGLPMHGCKNELVQRLAVASTTRASSAESDPTARDLETQRQFTNWFPSDYTSLGMSKLQDLCRNRSIAVGEHRHDLITQLRGSDPRNATMEELLVWCRSAGLSEVGTTAELAERIQLRMIHGADTSEKTPMFRLLKEERVEKMEKMHQRPPPMLSTAIRPIRVLTPAELKTLCRDHKLTATLAQLKGFCRDRKLKATGSRDELLQRLQTAGVITPSSRPTPIKCTGKKRKAYADETVEPRKQTKLFESHLVKPSNGAMQRSVSFLTEGKVDPSRPRVKEE